MPITLPPISRRTFLAGTASATAGCLMGRAAWGAEKEKGLADGFDPNRFALMADTHISGNRDQKSQRINMYDHLLQVVRQITAVKTIEGMKAPHLPFCANTILLGDTAQVSGKPEDYKMLIHLLKPIRQAGIAVHIALGNHDHRQRFWKAIPPTAKQDKAVVGRHITVVKTPRVNWFLLDSLQRTLHTPGLLGEKQLQWLADALDANKDKPAIVAAHHNPVNASRISGLEDTEALFKVLTPRKQVKAYFYGHTHRWKIAKQGDIHIVNLPTTAYPFGKSTPSGWVEAEAHKDGMTLTLYCIDPKHRQHDSSSKLKWR